MGRQVFVCIAKAFPVGLLFSLRQALSLPTAQLYYGVSKPNGDVVTSAYIEARNDLLSADIVVLILGESGDGLISDDWTLSFLRQLKAEAQVLIYTCRVETRDVEFVPTSRIDLETAVVRAVPTETDIVALVVADVYKLLGDSPN